MIFVMFFREHQAVNDNQWIGKGRFKGLQPANEDEDQSEDEDIQITELSVDHVVHLLRHMALGRHQHEKWHSHANRDRFFEFIDELMAFNEDRLKTAITENKYLKWYIPLQMVQNHFVQVYVASRSAGDAHEGQVADVLSEIENSVQHDSVQMFKFTQVLCQMSKKSYNSSYFSDELVQNIAKKWSIDYSQKKQEFIFLRDILICAEEVRTKHIYPQTLEMWELSVQGLLIRNCVPRCAEFSLQKTFGYLVGMDNIWSWFDVLSFVDRISASHQPNDKHLVLLMEHILAYGVPYIKVGDAVKKSSLSELTNTLKAEKEKQRDVNDLLEIIIAKQWASETVIERVRAISIKVETSLSKYGYPGALTGDPGVLAISSLKDIGQLRDDNLAECYTSLSCGVKKIRGWWPRATQMVSWAMLMLSDDKKGRLLEMNTGEGKSCTVALATAMLACHGKKVDVLTSSPILAARDMDEWVAFYHHFGLQVAHNINKAGEEKVQCYEANIVYGTVFCFAADILQQEFHLKDTRKARPFDCVIVDEIDFMLLDRGVQFTYLSHATPGLQHLGPIFALIWNMVRVYKPMIKTDGQNVYVGDKSTVHKLIYNIMPQGMFEDELHVLQLAESKNALENGFTKNYAKSSHTERMALLANMDASKITEIILSLNYHGADIELVPFKVNKDGMVESVMPAGKTGGKTIPILLGEKGMCYSIHPEESVLKANVVLCVRNFLRRQGNEFTDGDFQIEVPQHLYDFAQNRVKTWVDNAFLAMTMIEGREYIISQSESSSDWHLFPVDFSATGMVEQNKWRNGLQQFLEMKHKLKMTTLTLLTNFISNIAFFQRYKNNVYGLSASLGSDMDRTFLERHLNVDFCCMPTYLKSKLIEEKGEVVANKEIWLERIYELVKEHVEEKWWGTPGRAALVICDDINTAAEIYQFIRSKHDPNKKVLLYARNDTDEGEILSKEDIDPGEVVVATNLAGRGTNLATTEEVNTYGGLYVLVSHLCPNSRVEIQAFGRTGRKGKPGSAQIVLDASKLPDSMNITANVAHLKMLQAEQQQTMMANMDGFEVSECLRRERLFAEYCGVHLKKISKFEFKDDVDGDLHKAAVNALNEKWAMWLQMKSDEIHELQDDLLLQVLHSDMESAIQHLLHMSSPSDNIYHTIKFGNELMDECLYTKAYEKFSTAAKLNAKWSTFAHYNAAFCMLKSMESPTGSYTSVAMSHLESAIRGLSNYKGEIILTRELMTLSTSTDNEEDRGFINTLDIRLQILTFLEKNTFESITRLQQHEDDVVEWENVFTLIPAASPLILDELYQLWQMGLTGVFSVGHKKPFCWDPRLVFPLSALQVASNILLTAVRVGTADRVDDNLIMIAISDVIKALDDEDCSSFTWKEWANVEEVVLAVALIAQSSSKVLIQFSKQIKLSKSASAFNEGIKDSNKSSISTFTESNFKEACDLACVKVVRKSRTYVHEYDHDQFRDEVVKRVQLWVDRYVSEEHMLSQVRTCTPLVRMLAGIVHAVNDENVQSVVLEFKEFGQDAIDDVLNEKAKHRQEIRLGQSTEKKWRDTSKQIHQRLENLMDNVYSELIKVNGEGVNMTSAVDSFSMLVTDNKDKDIISNVLCQFYDAIVITVSEFCATSAICTDIPVVELTQKIDNHKEEMTKLYKAIGRCYTQLITEALTEIVHQGLLKQVTKVTQRSVLDIYNQG